MNDELIINQQIDLPIRSRIYQTTGIFIAGIGILWALTIIPWALDYIINPLSIGIGWVVTTLLYLIGEPVHQIGVVISSPAADLEITPACTGLYQSIVLITGILALSRTRMERWRGIVIGTIILMGINIFRIISIYYSALIIPEWVPFIHGVFWEGVMVLLVPLFWMYWLYQNKSRPAGSQYLDQKVFCLRRPTF